MPLLLLACGEAAVESPLGLDLESSRDSDPCDYGACEDDLTPLESALGEAEASTSGEAIVAVAMAELGRGPTQVGLDLTAYPYDLGRYLAVGEAWCSEFVAWSYRVQGDQPFTGGTQGGWMLRDSLSIRRWFEARGRWIDRSSPEWATFVPAPGDYVRYVWADGGSHSGIVRYAEGTTLYTVEGNVSNTVRAMTRYDYHNYSYLDGFGLLSDAAPPQLDVTPPSVPQGLALSLRTVTVSRGKKARTTTYVTASWLASSDDSGAVDHYVVYRNGAALGSTAQLAYQDGATSVGGTYAYAVAAVDAAGNVSAPCSTVTISR